jgi:glycerol kinase
MQFLADMLDAPVDRAEVQETTALGVALLAGWRAGVSQAPEEFPSNWRLGRRFAPQMGNLEREQRYRGWRDAVARTLLEPGG